MKILDIGKTHYEDALRIQKKFFEQKVKYPEREDIVILTEHFPVYTLGKTSKKEHILNIPEGIPVYTVERGGSVTFHGEGQIVVYPVIHLKGKNRSVKNNVDLDKSFFGKIVPCGIKDIPVCNISDFIEDVDFETVKKILIKNIMTML